MLASKPSPPMQSLFEKRDPMESPSPSAPPSSSTASSYSPPYASAARISDSLCYPQYTASLKCLEKSNSDKSKCQQQFDDYKECKERERKARLDRNKQRSLF